MTREEAKDFLPIITAFAEGKTIEVMNTSGHWDEINIPNFDVDPKKYRIKPKPKYRPFKDAEECWQEMQKHQPFGYVNDNGCYACILSVSNIDVSIMNASGDIITPSFGDLVEDITFVDGTPFGVKVEE